MAKSSPIDGTVILADEQFAGRGQAGNIWQADANKNLTFSLIYHTTFLKATEQFYLNMAVCLGIQAAVASLLPEHDRVSVKWPNDLFIGDQKVAGILIENTISGLYLKYSIIGIGLNVNQPFFPDAPNATSLALVLQQETDKHQVLEIILSYIEKYFFLLKEKKWEMLKRDYLKHLYRKGVPAMFKKEDVLFEATITNVDEFGNLEIETENGPQRYGFKEISFVL